MTQRIEIFERKRTQRIELFFFSMWLNELNFFFNLTQRIEFFFFFSEWLKDFVEYDSKNRTFLWIWLKVLSLFFNMTQGIESSFSEWLEDLNLILQMSQRIKPFLKKKKMTRRIDLLKNISNYRNFLMTQRIELLLKKTVTHRTEPFFHMIHRIEPFFSTWLKELNLFFLTCLINFFFCKKFKELNLLLSMTQRIEPFEHDSKNWTFFEHDSQKWTLFFSITQRMEHLRVWLKELDIFSFDSKNWTFCFTWLQEQNFFYSKNWTFFFSNLNQRIVFQKFHFK